jgi:hypothetical protein
MPSSLSVGNVSVALAQQLFPTVTTWNRLEGRPRTRSFDRALQAEVRDALWMLTKQWQMGEFRGSDAGSPIFAKLKLETTRLTKYQPDGKPPQLLDTNVPLDATVERRPLPLMTGGRRVALDLRLLMGRQWLALTKKKVGDYRQPFLDAYPFTAPDPSSNDEADRCAHPEVWQLFAAVAGRAMDGGALYAYLTADPTHHAYDGVVGIAAGDQGAIDECATLFREWFSRLFLQPPPAGDDAWTPERLEYQFATSAPLPAGEKVYVADEYYQGELDWHSLDVDSRSAGLGAVAGSTTTGLPPDTPQTLIPTPVTFSGMPNTRWWSFEDHRTNLGDIDASTTDLAKLLFMEYALIYANDWFIIPRTLPLGAVAAVRGLAITNVFGDRLWIEPAGHGPAATWQRWSMFATNVQGQGSAPPDPGLLLLPTAAKVIEAPPTEEVLLIRDEVANMVWGVEKRIQIASGDSKPGLEAARETLRFLQRGVPGPPPITAKAAIRYRVMTTVPENWIPFIPVHVAGSNREIQLQRAALPRIIERDPNPPVKVQPRTMLLREGLDRVPAQTYFLHEEEVPRAGTRLMQMFERTRWRDGRVYTWLRVRRQTGRGEGSSGLAFDRIANVPPPPA